MGRENAKIWAIIVASLAIIVSVYFAVWRISIKEAAELFSNGKLLEAKGKIESNIERFPKTKSDLIDGYRMLGEIHYRLGDFGSAERSFLRALEDDNQLPLPHYRLGLLRESEARYEEAFAEFIKVLDCASGAFEHLKDAQLHLATLSLRIGMRYYLGGEHETALKYYQLGLKSSPDFPELLHAMGLAHSKMGNFPEASRYFEEAVNLNPNLITLYVGIEKAFRKIGNRKQALRYAAALDKLKKEALESAEDQAMKITKNEEKGVVTN